MKYLKTFLFFILFLLTFNILLSILFYFDIISNGTNNIFKIIFLIIDLLLTGFIIGKKANKKGYIEGLKVSGIIIISALLFSLIFKYGINFKSIIIYFLSSLTCAAGSSIGINFKEKTK